MACMLCNFLLDRGVHDVQEKPHEPNSEAAMPTPTFPSLYAECAWHDGRRDALAGHSESRTAFLLRHGDPEAIGLVWYEAGRASVATEHPLTTAARRRAYGA